MAQEQPGILNVAPDDGLIQDEMVPEGEFADLDILEEDLVAKGFPPGLIGDLKSAMKKSPEFRAQMVAQVQKMVKYNRAERKNGQV